MDEVTYRATLEDERNCVGHIEILQKEDFIKECGRHSIIEPIETYILMLQFL